MATITPQSEFYYYKGMHPDELPTLSSKSKEFMKHAISTQIDMFAQEIMSHGHRLNRCEIKSAIRGRLYHSIKAKVVSYLKTHPQETIEDALLKKSAAIRSLICEKMPQFRPYLLQENQSFPIPVQAASNADVASVEFEEEISDPKLKDSIEEVPSKDEDDAAENMLFILQEQLNKLVDERTSLRRELNSLKHEERKLHFLEANLFDSVNERNAGHIKRKEVRAEHKREGRVDLSVEERFKRLESAITRNKSLIEKLEQDISAKRRANKQEHNKINFVIEMRRLAEEVVIDTDDNSERTLAPPIQIDEEQSFEAVLILEEPGLQIQQHPQPPVPTTPSEALSIADSPTPISFAGLTPPVISAEHVSENQDDKSSNNNKRPAPSIDPNSLRMVPRILKIEALRKKRRINLHSTKSLN